MRSGVAEDQAVKTIGKRSVLLWSIESGVLLEQFGLRLLRCVVLRIVDDVSILILGLRLDVPGVVDRIEELRTNSVLLLDALLLLDLITLRKALGCLLSSLPHMRDSITG